VTTPLRLLHVTRERGSDARYGIGKSLAPVIAALREQGHQVMVHDGDASAACLPTGFTAWLGRQLWRLVERHYAPPGDEQGAALAILNMVEERARIAWTAAQQAARGGYTHVHCHDPVLAWLYARFARFAPWTGPRARWGLTEHGYGMFVQPRVGVPIPPRLLHQLQSWERWVAAHADWLCAPSAAGLRQLAVDLGMDAAPDIAPPAHWQVVPHPRPPLHLPLRAEARQALGVADSDWLILGVGQLIPMKRFDWVLAACARLPMLPERRPLLLLLGEGDADALQAQAAALGLAGRLRIEVTDDIGRYLAAADVYVSASATESFGMANCEALAAGLPAVCTAVGAVPSVVGEAAWLIDDQGPAEAVIARLASALAAMHGDAEVRAHWAAAARQWAVGWLTPAEVAGQMVRCYRPL
jgi:glycosyltransferase involved in cell wall biosynthesis